MVSKKKFRFFYFLFLLFLIGKNRYGIGKKIGNGGEIRPIEKGRKSPAIILVNGYFDEH